MTGQAPDSDAAQLFHFDYEPIPIASAGERIFGAGINLTLLYQGQIDYLFYVVRDLGYVNKLFRGLAGPRATEKLWIAGVERYAIGGACQLLYLDAEIGAAHEGATVGNFDVRSIRFQYLAGDRLQAVS